MAANDETIKIQILDDGALKVVVMAMVYMERMKRYMSRGIVAQLCTQKNIQHMFYANVSQSYDGGCVFQHMIAREKSSSNRVHYCSNFTLLSRTTQPGDRISLPVHCIPFRVPPPFHHIPLTFNAPFFMLLVKQRIGSPSIVL